MAGGLEIGAFADGVRPLTLVCGTLISVVRVVVGVLWTSGRYLCIKRI